MVCCAAFSMILALLVAVKARIFPGRATVAPLAWRLEGAGLAPAGFQPSQGFSVAARLRSFRYAAAGMVYLLRREHNARLHAIAAVVVVALAVMLNVSAADWRWLVVAIAMVFAAEALNTAVERICDLVSPGPHEMVRAAKDVAAAAVLVLAIAAAVVGALTFAPYLAGFADHHAWVLDLCSTGPT